MSRRKLDVPVGEGSAPKMQRTTTGDSVEPIWVPQEDPNAEKRTRRVKIFFGHSVDPSLAAGILEDTQIPCGKVELKKFNDGEISVTIHESVRYCHAYVVQSTCSYKDYSVNDNLMQLILLIDALKRASAKSITVIIPYFGYARQDRKTRSRVPISASAVSRLIEKTGASRIIALDLHCGQIQGFFDIPVDNLFGSVAFVPRMAALFRDSDKVTVVSPDAGGVDRCMNFMKGLGVCGITCSLAMCIKQRSQPGVVAHIDMVGAPNVMDADCVIVDDIADTCGTLVAAIRELKKYGARRVYACISHPVFSGKAIETLEKCAQLDQLFVTDTVPMRRESVKVTCISVAKIIGTAIRRNFKGGSISQLFDFSRAAAFTADSDVTFSPAARHVS